MSWFQSLWRRMFGPSAADILQVIVAKLDSFTDSATKIANTNHRAAVGIEQSEARLAELLERLNSEPFMALKKWIDDSTKSNGNHAEQRREFNDRERQLLERWKNQVDHLQETIEEQRHLMVPVTSPIVDGKATRDIADGELINIPADEAAKVLTS